MSDVPDTPVLEENPSSPSNANYYNQSNDEKGMSLELDNLPSTSHRTQPLILDSEQNTKYGETKTPSGININYIDKNLRRNFQGTSNGDKRARIGWVNNRVPQLFGLGLCLTLLAVTIIFRNERWIGLVTGSILTIICGTAVCGTYISRKRWHQHPNPIVCMRSILSIFFAICLLLNLQIDFNTESLSNECKSLAGITEFFIITTEAWGLMMACDLFFSLLSPFTNYKRLIKIYHIWVWSLGLIFAMITWRVEDAAGFFRVDGKRIVSSQKEEVLIGFCLAASQQCCDVPENTDIDSIEDSLCNEDQKKNLCLSNSRFSDTQFWPWILIYSFVLFVLIVSVSVLILAWHRLYLRGVPKTYHIRLRVLNYVSFFTGAYVFYWLLLLLLYMSTFFVSTRQTEEDEQKTIVVSSQILRQIVLFIIASKGYLDYVIWFAVNSIEWSGSDHGEQNDVDLAPQVNTALRSEILYYTTTGIRYSVKAVEKCPPGQEQFFIGTGDKREKTKQKIKFFSFSPQIFRCIREFFGINDEEYISLFRATTKERFSEGRSGAFMFYTADESMIVKTMSKEEAILLKKVASDYASYLFSNPRSMLTRFYGCHTVYLYGKAYYFVVMGNIFDETDVIHYRYDIKGSWVDRNARFPNPGDQAYCRYCNASYIHGSRTNQECSNGLNYHEPNIVLKDNDLLTKVRIDQSHAEALYGQLCLDSEFLSGLGIMDYSLLMGVHSSEYYVQPENQIAQSTNCERTDSELNASSLSLSNFRSMVATSVHGPSYYHFGVIDFLQQWTLQKKLERFYKTKVRRKDPNGVSAMPPNDYRIRFQRKMAQILAVPSKYPEHILGVLNDTDIQSVGGATLSKEELRGLVPAPLLDSAVESVIERSSLTRSDSKKNIVK